MGSSKEKAVLKPKINWNKIVNAHPLWREKIARNEGVAVSCPEKKIKEKAKNMELFNNA
tara:strand:- start:275 stop:451 length:177 start_codon:yes stop_codon:yes gene_type:complete